MLLRGRKVSFGIKSAVSVLCGNLQVLLGFEVVFRSLLFCILTPLLRLLFGLLPEPAARWLLPAFLLPIGLAFSYELVVLLLYCAKSRNGEPMTLRSLCREAAGQMQKLFSKSRLVLLFVIPACLLSCVFLFNGSFLQARIPEGLLQTAAHTPLRFIFFIVFVLFLHAITAFYLLGLPGVLLEGKTFSSFRREDGALRSVGIWIAALLTFYLLSTLILLAVVLLLAGAMRAFCSPENSRAGFQFYFLWLQSIWGKLTGVLTPFFACAVSTALYDLRKGDSPLALPAAPRGISRRKAVRTASLILAAFLLTFLCAFRAFPKFGVPVKIVAHRAGAALGPENTVAALQQAIRFGADMAEIDVQRLRDGTLIVLHDDTFQRTAGVDLSVRDADYDMVKKMDAGSWFSPDFAGEPIPTLEEMLAAAKGKIRLMIELKTGGGRQGLAENTLRLIEQYDMTEECVIASADAPLLEHVEALRHDIPTVFISAQPPEESSGGEAWDFCSVENAALSSKLVTRMHAKGIGVYVWTANTRKAIRRIASSEADGVITDNPVTAMFCLRDGAQRMTAEKWTEALFP